ncbi:MAG: ADP-forming succinate--CoA ligase subunit beta [Rickettsiales bacterium]|nr:ADP-forming succinate--CoA ligase subunit beta [Rickettsiales bacterium]
MNIHEYQAKQLLAKHGVPVPNGIAAFSVEEAVSAAENLQTSVYVVKAQIHAGGRGKAGGVKVVKSIEEVKTEAKRLLGSTLITHQTGPEGKEVNRLYIEEGSNIAKEFYLSAVADRETSNICFVVSKEGGMDIEEVAESNPEKIIKVYVDPTIGVQGHNVRSLAFGLGLEKTQLGQFAKLINSIFDVFVKSDCSQVEINPLVETNEKDLIALDAKINFDDNALYRQKDIVEFRDETEENELESRASDFGLSYIKMDGDIGCMVNGAGLAMATMDIIKLYGSEPANFLDVGGGATKEKVTEAFKIILSDTNVKGILVNIFGGIMRCDIIAEGIIAAAKEVSISIPLVVRLEGTNVELGKQALSNSGLDIIPASDLDDAAIKIVDAVNKNKNVA